MNHRASALWLACAAQALALHLPVSAQGLRPTMPLPGARPAPARPADNSPRAADYIVAVVNAEPITNHEVRTRMGRFEQQLAQQGQRLPPPAEFRRQVLDRLISEKAQLQLARELGIKVEDSAVDQAEQTVARQNGIEVPELRRRAAAEGLPLSQFRDELRSQITLTRLRERELESRIKVSDQDVEQYLREQQAGGNNAPAEINLAHILVAVPENANDAQVARLRARAQQVRERARAGEEFAKLAREFSDAPGNPGGDGSLGLRSPERYPALFVQAVENLAEGGVSDVVRSGAGFHVLKLVEKRKSAAVGMNVVQTHARHILLRPGPQLSEGAAVQKLQDFRKRIEAGQADFAQLAKDFSQDASARAGGDLGWATPGMFVPEFEEALAPLAPGQLGGPIISRFGVHLLQLLERRQAALSPREQREVARNLVREKKLDEAYAQWAQEVRGRAYVEFREPPQ